MPRRRRIPSVTLGCAVFGSAASVGDTPLLGRLLAAVGILAAIRWAWRQRRTRVDVALGTVATALSATPAARFVARQYPQRLAADERLQLVGPLLPVLLWTTLLSAAIGLLAVAGTRLTRGGRLSVRLTALACAALGFLVRVYSLINIAPARTDGGDPLYYHTQANGLARGLGFIEPLNWIANGTRIPTAVHGPGYPIYLSMFSRLGATTWFDHRMASVVAGTVTVAVAVMLTARLSGRLLPPTLAGLFAALAPNLWTIDGVFFPEGLFVALTGIGLLAADRWYERRRWGDALLFGASIGGAALVRGEGVLTIPLVVLPMAWMLRRVAGRRAWLGAGLTTLSAVAVIAPWTIRNMGVFTTFVPLSTNSNELFVYANCDEVYSGKLIGFWSFACQERLRDTNGDGIKDFEPPGDEAEKAKYWQQVGLDYARDHRARLPAVAAARVGRQWDLFRPLQNAEFAAVENRSTYWAKIGLGCYYTLAIGALGGVRQLRRRRRFALPVYMQFAAVTITALYAYGTTRFRAPAELALCVLAGIGAAPLVGQIGDWLGRPTDRVDASGRLTGRRWLPWMAAVAVVGPALRGLFVSPGPTMEEGFMLVFPERVMRGALANVDFLHLYGPGSLDLLATVYRLVGVTVSVERTVGLLVNLAIVAALIVLARPWGRIAQTSTAIVGALVVLAPTGLTALAWPMAIACGLWSIVAGLRCSWPSRLAAGLLAGLALSIRPDLLLAVGAAHCVAWWTTQRGQPGADRRRTVLIGAGALLAGLSPLIVHVARIGPATAWRGMFIEPVFDLRSGRSLPRPPSPDYLQGALQVIGEKPVPPWWPLPSLTPAQQLFVWFFAVPLLGLVALIACLRWYRRTPQEPRLARLLTAMTFSLALVSQAAQRPDSTHLLWGSVVLWPLSSALLVERGRQRRRRSAARLTNGGRLAPLVPLVVVLAVLPSFTARTWLTYVRTSMGTRWHGLAAATPVVNGDRSFRLGDRRSARAAQAAVDDLAARSAPGQRLLVGPVDLRQTAYSDVFFYYLFPNLTPATRYIEMDPGLANTAGSGLADDVTSADWLILTRFWSGWIEPNSSVTFGPDDANVAVESHFCLVGSYEQDLVRLYRACPGGGAPGPYEGPYDPTVDYAVEVAVPVPPRSDGTFPPGSPAATTELT